MKYFHENSLCFFSFFAEEINKETQVWYLRDIVIEKCKASNTSSEKKETRKKESCKCLKRCKQIDDKILFLQHTHKRRNKKLFTIFTCAFVVEIEENKTWNKKCWIIKLNTYFSVFWYTFPYIIRCILTIQTIKCFIHFTCCVFVSGCVTILFSHLTHFPWIFTRI